MTTRNRSTNLLRDALYNLSPKSGANQDYCRGLVVGLVSGLMSEGRSYSTAAEMVSRCLPADYREDCLPESLATALTKNCTILR
jgi:hypothetical protein